MVDLFYKGRGKWLLCLPMRFLFAGYAERAAEAERCYNRALAIQPDHVTANTNMAHLCRIQGRWEQALKHYRVASGRRPGDPRLHYYVAQMLNKRGQTEVCIFPPRRVQEFIFKKTGV